jgi:hypothetical protein
MAASDLALPEEFKRNGLAERHHPGLMHAMQPGVGAGECSSGGGLVPVPGGACDANTPAICTGPLPGSAVFGSWRNNSGS